MDSEIVYEYFFVLVLFCSHEIFHYDGNVSLIRYQKEKIEVNVARSRKRNLIKYKNTNQNTISIFSNKRTPTPIN